MARLLAAILLIFGLLPIANWIPGGHEAPWYGERLAMWLPATVIIAGIVVIAALVLRNRPALWRGGAWARIAAHWHSRGWAGDLALAAAALITYAAVTRLIFHDRPTVIDEILQLFQARIFASGALWLPVPEVPSLRSVLFLIDTGGKLYGQFPAGGPAMIALGTLAGAEWLVGPVFGAASVLLFARLLRRIEPEPGVALAAVLLFAWAPFVVFMSGTLMNHVTSLTFILAAALGVVVATRDEQPRPWAAFFCGLALGMVGAIRPLDGALVALPTAVWFLSRLRLGRRQLTPLLASGLGVAIPLAALMYVNAQWTGSPMLFGYEVLWGSGVGLGFGSSAWGQSHTPLLGTELISLYFLRLQSFLFETPVPGLLFATGTLALTRRWRAADRWIGWCTLLLLIGYFSYWHDGYHLGPRFMYPLAPWLAWWTARLPATFRERDFSPIVPRLAVVAGTVALLLGATQLLPIRAHQYAVASTTMPGGFDSAARAAGIHDATILVRETWGAQMIARLWALGVSRPETEEYYRTTDACVLESAITAVERSGGGAAAVVTALAPSRADVGRLVAFRGSADTTLRVLPGAHYSARCIRRLKELEAGRTVWASALLAQDDNTWMRDLHDRNRGSIDFERPIWLFLRAPVLGGGPTFLPVDVDSMRREWALDSGH